MFGNVLFFMEERGNINFWIEENSFLYDDWISNVFFYSFYFDKKIFILI